MTLAYECIHARSGPALVSKMQGSSQFRVQSWFAPR